MRIRNPFSAVLANPFVDSMLAANAARQIIPLFQGADHTQEFINAAQAGGAPVTSIPRRGLLSFISPNIQATPDQLNQEKIALQNQGAKQLGTDIELRAALGPQNYAALKSNPRFSAMLANAPDFAAFTPQEANQEATRQRLEQFHQDALNEQNANRQERQQEHADSDALRAQGQAISAQNAQANQQMRQMIAQMQDDTRKATQRLEQERNDDARRARYDQSVQNLENDQQKASAMLTSANPADPKTVQSLLDTIYSRGQALKATADKYGYDYDPALFERLSVSSTPGKMQTLSRGLLGSPNVSVGPASVAPKPTQSASTNAATSKSGRKIVADTTSPTGYRYAD